MNRFFQEHPDYTPSKWTLIALFNEAGDQLASGQHHYYWGSLTPAGTEVEHLYLFLGSELLARKIVAQDYIAHDQSAIRNSIRTMR